MLVTNKAHRKCLNTETCELYSPDQRKSIFKNRPFRGRFYTNGLHFLLVPTGVNFASLDRLFQIRNNFMKLLSTNQYAIGLVLTGRYNECEHLIGWKHHRFIIKLKCWYKLKIETYRNNTCSSFRPFKLKLPVLSPLIYRCYGTNHYYGYVIRKMWIEHFITIYSFSDFWAACNNFSL